jgi:exopolyphosphatase/guanosine-5'-triphosphate,3'-diphosphate pyrophosphatase
MARYAAIDVGSNSVRMEAAEVSPPQAPRILASDREVTRLGESVFTRGVVSQEALEATCTVLARMAETWRHLGVEGVRAVATSAIRDTRNQAEFLERASAAAGTPVEIISGREEARLIHLGVESGWPQAGRRVLIVDIGGGSAEIIAAENGHMREAFSRPLGAVRLQSMFLRDDPPTRRQLRQLEEYIDGRLAPALKRLAGVRWERAIATSATAAAVAGAVGRLGRAAREEADRRRVTTAQVRRLYARLFALPLAGRRKTAGIGPRRAEIIVPGTAVLLRCLEAFQLPAVYYCRAGVRDGIIADLAARGVGSELSRLGRDERREVEAMSRRFGVAPAHARQVAELARALFLGLQPLHGLTPQWGRILEAAACLHDIGHFVSSSGHHKHSYYVVSNSDLPGFTSREREWIALLCRYHRKSLPAAVHGVFQSLSSGEQRALTLLIPLLRLADSLDRGHDQKVRGVECRVNGGQAALVLRAPADVSIEQWAAERAAEVFRQVYNIPLVVARSRTP